MANSKKHKVYGNLQVRHHLQDTDAEDRVILKVVTNGTEDVDKIH